VLVVRFGVVVFLPPNVFLGVVDVTGVLSLALCTTNVCKNKNSH
jgi:hypothetical protein